MPVMTKPLAHLEMMLDDTRAKMEALELDRIKIVARLDQLAAVKWELQSVLDEERKKLSRDGDNERE